MFVPSVAVIVTLSPDAPPVADMVGVVSFVTLSVFDEPESLAAAMSGADGADVAVVSRSRFNGVDDGDTLPAGSVRVPEIDQLPGVRVGRSHDVATPIV